MDYDNLGSSAIDAFENILRLIATEENNLLSQLCFASSSTHSSSLIVVLFRKLIEFIRYRRNENNTFDLTKLFYVWKLCLTNEKKLIRLEFLREFMNQLNFYSTFLNETLNDNCLSDYCLVSEILHVLNSLLTMNLENYIFKSTFFDETEKSTEEFAKFVLKFCSKLNYSPFLMNKSCHWFGGIVENYCSNNNNVDPCLQRLIILVNIKSELLLSNNSDKNNFIITNFELSSQSVINLFLDQDDQLCELLICNIMHK